MKRLFFCLCVCLCVCLFVYKNDASAGGKDEREAIKFEGEIYIRLSSDELKTVFQNSVERVGQFVQIVYRNNGRLQTQGAFYPNQEGRYSIENDRLCLQIAIDGEKNCRKVFQDSTGVLIAVRSSSVEKTNIPPQRILLEPYVVGGLNIKQDLEKLTKIEFEGNTYARLNNSALRQTFKNTLQHLGGINTRAHLKNGTYQIRSGGIIVTEGAYIIKNDQLCIQKNSEDKWECNAVFENNDDQLITIYPNNPDRGIIKISLSPLNDQ